MSMLDIKPCWWVVWGKCRNARMKAWIYATFWCEIEYVPRGNMSHYHMPTSYVWYLGTDSSQKCLRHFLQRLPPYLTCTWGMQHCNSSLGCPYKLQITLTPGIFYPGAEWHRTSLLIAEADPAKMPCRCMWNTKRRFLSVVKLIYLAEIQFGPFSSYFLPLPHGLKHNNKQTWTQWARNRHCDSSKLC